MSLHAMRLSLYKHSKRLTQGLVGILLRGLALSYSGMLITAVLGTVIQSLINHQLGTEGYGEYKLLLTSLSFIALLLGVGFDTWTLKEGASHPEQLADIVWQVLLLKSIGFSLVFIAISMSLIGQAHYTPALLFGVLAMACTSFTQTAYAALRVHQRNGWIALYQIGELLLLLIALLISRTTSLTLTMLMIMRGSVTLIMSVVLFRHLIKVCGSIHPHLNPLRALRGVWPYMLSDGLANIYGQTPLIILGWNLGVVAVGMFSPALDLIILLYTIPNLAFLIILPLLSGVDIKRSDFDRLVHLFIAGSVVFGISAFWGIRLLGQRALHAMTGATHTETYAYLLLLSVIPLLKAFSFTAVAIMLACNHIRSRILVQAITAIVCLSLGLIFIPAYGTSGVITLILIIEVLLLTLYSLAAYRAYRLRFLQRPYEDYLTR